MADNEVGPERVVDILLADGGRVEFTDWNLEELGDDGTRAYRRLTYIRDADGDRPACKITFEVRDRRVVCASFTLSTDTKTGVCATDLRAIRLDELGHDVYGHFGVFRPNPAGPGWVQIVGSASFRRDRKTVEQAAKRRKITREFLERVAEVHRNAPAGERLQAVIEAFPTFNGSPPSQRQALRYIRQAREKELIND